MPRTQIKQIEVIDVAKGNAIESTIILPSVNGETQILIGDRNKTVSVYKLDQELHGDNLFPEEEEKVKEDSPVDYINSSSTSGSKILKEFKFRGSVSDSIYSEVGNKIISAVKEDLIITDKLTKETTSFKGHKMDITCVDINKENNKIVSGSRDYGFILWNTQGEIISKFNKNIEGAHKSWVNCIGFIPGASHMVVTGSEDGTVKIWDVKTNVLLKTYFEGKIVSSPITTTSGQTSTSTPTSTPAVGTEDLLKKTSVPCYDNSVKSITFSKDGSILIYGGRDSKVYIVNLNTDDLLTCFTVENKITVIASSDNQPLLAIAIPNSIIFYNIVEDMKVSEFVFSTKREVACNSLLFDGNQVIAGLSTGKLLRLEICTG